MWQTMTVQFDTWCLHRTDTHPVYFLLVGQSWPQCPDASSVIVMEPRVKERRFPKSSYWQKTSILFCCSSFSSQSCQVSCNSSHMWIFMVFWGQEIWTGKRSHVSRLIRQNMEDIFYAKSLSPMPRWKPDRCKMFCLGSWIYTHVNVWKGHV